MGQRRSKPRAIRFQGIPGGVARGFVPRRVVASCPIPVGSKRRWCDSKSFVYTRVAWRIAYTRSNQDSVHTRSLPRFCLYQVIPRFSLYQVIPRFCLYQATSKILFIPAGVLSLTHTSVRGMASAWAADTHQSSDCDGICVTRVSWAMTLVEGDWYHQSPRL